MSNYEKKAYYYQIIERYQKSSKKEKSIILQEFCNVCEYNRKYAIRILNKSFKPKTTINRAGSKPKYYSEDFITTLKIFWSSSDYMCSKRLKAAIPLWIPFYDSMYGKLDQNVKKLLLAISSATIDRLLKKARLNLKKGLSGTKPGTLLKNKIPIRTHNWDITKPGFMEADTVAHCGNSLSGSFIWSLTMTDIRTGWTENRAIWNKGASDVLLQIKDIENSIPFDLRGFDCDNGSEFLNNHLLKYFTENGKNTKFTRSRPYKKNDNAHVEQKNWTQVRQLFGYDRFDNRILVEQMNDLYSNEWALYNNYFRPSQKLIKKTKINSKYIRKYDIPKTPYLRIIESKDITKEQKESLKKTYKKLNPFKLKDTIECKLKEIFKHVSVT
jgi:hypothetical protein